VVGGVFCWLQVIARGISQACGRAGWV